ncbi:hypothetical protein NOCA1120162 [metagenome]|uniref:Uncharacterized protein n=1 Tax=metagenome TaxID=256318 RepID=A0A2P2C3Z0_9ZZZZ
MTMVAQHMRIEAAESFLATPIGVVRFQYPSSDA